MDCVAGVTRSFLFTGKFVERVVRCGKYSSGVYVSTAFYGSQLGADYCIYRRRGDDCTVYQSEKGSGRCAWVTLDEVMCFLYNSIVSKAKER